MIIIKYILFFTCLPYSILYLVIKAIYKTLCPDNDIIEGFITFLKYAIITGLILYLIWKGVLMDALTIQGYIYICACFMGFKYHI